MGDEEASECKQKCMKLRFIFNANCILASLGICGIVSFLIAFLVFGAMVTNQNKYDSSDTFPGHQNYSNLGDDLYPICYEMNIENYLTALDMVFLSKASYYTKDKKELSKQFQLWFTPNQTNEDDDFYNIT